MLILEQQSDIESCHYIFTIMQKYLFILMLSLNFTFCLQKNFQINTNKIETDINKSVINGSIKLVDNYYASIYLQPLRDINDNIHVKTFCII